MPLMVPVAHRDGVAVQVCDLAVDHGVYVRVTLCSPGKCITNQVPSRLDTSLPLLLHPYYLYLAFTLHTIIHHTT